jgi:hypothetical protein
MKCTSISFQLGNLHTRTTGVFYFCTDNKFGICSVLYHGHFHGRESDNGDDLERRCDGARLEEAKTTVSGKFVTAVGRSERSDVPPIASDLVY